MGRGRTAVAAALSALLLAGAGAAVAQATLAQPDPPPGRARGQVVATARCELGVRLPDGLDDAPAAPLPASGGIFFTEVERTRWHSRIADDAVSAAAGDWDRIAAHTRALLLHGEPGWRADAPAEGRREHGSRVRDAAFFHLLTGQPRVLEAVRAALLAEATNPANEFAAVLCLRAPGGPTLDAHADAAVWLLRQAVAYDFVRRGLATGERRAIEAALRRNAEVLAVHLAWGLEQVFPARSRGDYTQRRGDAAASGDAAWWAKRFDTNGDCERDARDDPRALPAYAYLRGDGTRGPRLSVLSQWFNNRKSAQAAAVGAVGLLLGDAALLAQARRYVMEWLAYSVWPDGSQGEFARNGDYCIAGQGAVYAQSNVQAAVLLAVALARQGDRSLADFSTREGLFGSAGGPKGIEQAALALLRLRDGELDWHLDEPWKPRPEPRRGTALGAAQRRFRGGAPVDDYHELGLLAGAALWPALAPRVLREAGASALPFPGTDTGADGRAVDTGFGRWTDVFNALPAMLLLRP